MPNRLLSCFSRHPAPLAARLAARFAFLLGMTLALSFGQAQAPVHAETAKTQSSEKKKSAAEKKKKSTKEAAKKKKKRVTNKDVAKSGKKESSKPVVAQRPRMLPKASSALLSRPDLDASLASFAEADRRHWPEAMRHANRISNPVAKKIMIWNRLIAENSGATTAEIASFQEQNPEWPRQAILSQRAEEALLNYPLSDSNAIEWFSAHEPLTGEGKLAYAKALLASGKKDEGRTWIRRAWKEGDFSQTRQREILNNYGSHLDTATHRARLERLLWEKRSVDARFTAALIGDNARALADARLKLAAGTSNATAAVALVPSSLRDDPGLIYDQVRFQRRRDNDMGALSLLLTAPSDAEAMFDPHAWWVERKIAARTALTNRDYDKAYRIVSTHGLKRGADFAEAAFMSGWIALQYLNKPGDALKHFVELKNNVSTPISLSRAEYWAGRAAEAKGDATTAKSYYSAASLYPTTFYGQLATAALSDSDRKLKLARDPNASSTQRAEFRKLELVMAAQMLHDLGRETQTWSFMLHLADILKDPEQLAELSDLAMTYNDPKLSLRIAKAASQRNIVLAERAYPTSRIPTYAMKGPRVEKALVYGLTRQESEFDQYAMSSAGARGLMQLMPATARMTAKQISVPYSELRLTSDPAYNAMLGSAHLGDLIGSYGGSYIMSIAAYNAGKSRVTDWMGRFGDPRSRSVDPIDWIESIPFTETRNYVQRVMENTEIYRTRLEGAPQSVRLHEDLRRAMGASANEAYSPTAAADAAGLAPKDIVQPGRNAQPGASLEEPDRALSENMADQAEDADESTAETRTPLEPSSRNRGTP